jgi:two-component system, LytTR family, response regulator
VRPEEPPPKIRTLIVDDEPLARSNLVVLLRLDPEIEIVSECGSGVEALVEIRSAKPDLVFLDIQMPECDGFDVLELLGRDLPPAIVFVTAYDQYAVRAFEAGALDYLLKPFDNARFDRALGRAKQRMMRGKDLPRKLERWAIKSGGQVSFVRIAEIDWIEAADYYSCLHVGARTHLLRLDNTSWSNRTIRTPWSSRA